MNTYIPHNKRYQHTLNFLKQVLPAPAIILDLGIRNPFSEIIEENGCFVININGENLDLLIETVRNHKVYSEKNKI